MQYCSKKGTRRTFLAICMAISNAFIRSWMWRTAAWLDENFVSSSVSWLICESFLFFFFFKASKNNNNKKNLKMFLG